MYQLSAPLHDDVLLPVEYNEAALTIERLCPLIPFTAMRPLSPCNGKKVVLLRKYQVF
jgi:hypothetical protein